MTNAPARALTATVQFHSDRVARRKAGELFPWSSIRADGTVTLANGLRYDFEAVRVYDKREPQGQRVEWHVDLWRYTAKGGFRCVQQRHMADIRAAITRAFKALIEADNARIETEAADSQVKAGKPLSAAR